MGEELIQFELDEVRRMARERSLRCRARSTLRFLSYLVTLKDVFLVNESQVMEWSKNPKPADTFRSCIKRTKAPCKPVTCKLKKGNDGDRYIRSCVACPKSYPWLGNPLGNAQ